MFNAKGTYLNQQGAAAVEFAIVLPLLILLVFGIVEFSVALYDKAMLTNASREGARTGALFRQPQQCGPDLHGTVSDVVDDFCAGKLITFGPAAAVTTVISPSCPARGEDLSVTLTYVYNWLVIPNFVAGIIGPATIGATTVMRMEQ
jgi:hypothetical protein